ncbi:spore cortex-lytic enzyme [Aminobacter sp. MSH1]|uniref:cell wall hydrolase n=1 Tax=Aminobacter sp. MSH1 TaxID=374606 RepID=UPI000D376EAD|nr:cell wall hydrolase [Aminobacter sp. MSH1]AWC25359.1 spore cortex-lytic enzyme [Aminobacter sp. MSH1]
MANQRDFNDFVDTIIAEAAGEGRKGMVAVASVINNRATVRGQTVGEVVRAPNQFDGYSKPGSAAKKAQQNAKMRAEAERIARDVLAGKIEDPTGGADHFYSGANKPGWASKLAKTVDIGGHKFHQSPQAASKLGNAIRQTANAIGDVASAVTAPVRQVAAGVGNMASALRTAAFPSFAMPSRPSVDIPGLLSYDLAGAKRNQIPTSGIGEKVSAAASGVIPGTTTTLYSGMEPRGLGAIGAKNRHPLGFAGDFHFTAPNGQKITDPVALQDIAMSMAAQHNANIGYGQTGYMGPGRMHIDTMPLEKFGGGAQWGNTAQSWAKNLDFARKTGIGPTPYTNAPTPSPRPSPPDTMMAAPAGKVERGKLAPATPRAPDPARFAYDTQPNPERFGPRTQTATAKVDRLPSKTIQEPNPARFAYDVPTTKTPAPERFGYGLVSPAAAATPQAPNANMSLADQYASYGAGKVPNPTPAMNAMMSPNVGPLTQTGLMPPNTVVPGFVPATPAPAPITTPTMPRLPSPINQRINQAVSAPPPSVPQYTAADVYAGRANSGVATGGNTVSRDQWGNTSVTNKYGVTTTTGPNGQQMASSGPGIAGPLGSNSIPTTPQAPSNLGSKVRGGLGTVVGGGLGGFLGGPIGAALGAVVAGDLAKGKNPLDRLGIGTFGMPVTDQFGFTQQMRFANPQSGGPFPNAPTGVAGALGGRQSNRSDRAMRDISPRAADAISKGVGGLY